MYDLKLKNDFKCLLLTKYRKSSSNVVMWTVEFEAFEMQKNYFGKMLLNHG